jgi:hypothetical protein
MLHQVRVCGDKDERDAYAMLLQTRFGFYPAKAGHTDVADDHIWLESDSRGHQFVAVAYSSNHIKLHSQYADDAITHPLVIVRDQDA